MNSTHTLPSAVPYGPSRSVRFLPAAPSTAPEKLESRFALRIVSRLTEASEGLSPDIGERLRVAREQALLRARDARAGAPAAPEPLHRRLFASGASVWRFRIAAALPALALVAGLVTIQAWQDATQIAAAAEIDAALLSDTLPPTAYSDAGFAEYLKTPSE